MATFESSCVVFPQRGSNVVDFTSSAPQLTIIFFLLRDLSGAILLNGFTL